MEDAYFALLEFQSFLESSLSRLSHSISFTSIGLPPLWPLGTYPGPSCSYTMSVTVFYFLKYISPGIGFLASKHLKFKKKSSNSRTYTLPSLQYITASTQESSTLILHNPL